jgi:ATP-dependent Clp protease ATP-binding subunit ClpC
VNLLPSALRWLAQQGYDPQYGARPLRRAIQRHIESPLSIRILSGDFGPETLVDIDLEAEQLVFRPSPEGAPVVSVSVPLVGNTAEGAANANPS